MEQHTTDTAQQTYLATADVARLAGLTPAAVLRDVRLERLRVAARTARGQRLFAERDVAEYVATRAVRRELREQERAQVTT